jgi:hypothetical protein
MVGNLPWRAAPLQRVTHDFWLVAKTNAYILR